jgi:hypothetical protein
MDSKQVIDKNDPDMEFNPKDVSMSLDDPE